MEQRAKVKSIILRQERDRDIYRIYCRAIRELDFKCTEELYDYIGNQPAPKFYIEPMYVREVISAMLNNKKVENWNSGTQRKFDELFRRYNEYVATHKKEYLSMNAICEIITAQPAPEFYLSARSIRSIIQKQKEKEWEKIKERFIL